MTFFFLSFFQKRKREKLLFLVFVGVLIKQRVAAHGLVLEHISTKFCMQILLEVPHYLGIKEMGYL
jgi:hypothetical protein